jgi:hypothetical protein
MADDRVTTPEHESLKARAINELKSFLYITLYFWVLFLTFDVFRAGTLAEYHVSPVSQGFAIINALVLAKVTLIEEGLYARRRLRDVPLVYCVLSHALLLTAILIVFHGIEELVGAMFHGKGLAESVAAFNGGRLESILSTAVIYLVVLIPFCAFQELARLVGERALREAFFASRKGVAFSLIQEIQPNPVAES